MSTFTDKHAIVLDVGARYIKSGVSEERAPRCVERWEISELLAARADLPTCRAYIAAQLHRICFDLMHVNPRHRRFLVCEDVLGPRCIREAIVDVLFTDFKASAVTLVPSAIAALYATSHHTALVVDCGYNETRLLPVYKGISLLYCFSTVSVGSASCCEQLQQALGPQNALPTAQVEDVFERACFVQPLQNRIMEVADATFRLQGTSSLVVPAAVRSDACENLFIGHPASGESVVSCIEDLLEKLPLDVRAAMVENILVIGGASMLPGFCGRLREELVASLEPTKPRLSGQVNVLRPLFPRNVLSWVGASILATTELGNESTISVNEYASAGSRCLPDWASIAETEI